MNHVCIHLDIDDYADIIIACFSLDLKFRTYTLEVRKEVGKSPNLLSIDQCWDGFSSYFHLVIL